MKSDLTGKWFIAPPGAPLPDPKLKDWTAPWRATGEPPSEYKVWESSAPDGERMELEPIPRDARRNAYTEPNFRGTHFVSLGWESVDGAHRTIFHKVDLRDGTLHMERAGSKHTENYLTHFVMDPPPKPIKQINAVFRGWRQWKFTYEEAVADGGGMIPVLKPWSYSSYSWQPGWNEAIGYEPHRGGEGGFYVATDLGTVIAQSTKNDGDAWLKGTQIWGTAILAGRIRTAEHGARGARGKPESIVLTGDIEVDAKLLEVAQRYNLRVFDTFGSAKQLTMGWDETYYEEAS
jgi:hypothetical protein